MPEGFPVEPAKPEAYDVVTMVEAVEKMMVE